jgi:hypothetical protein
MGELVPHLLGAHAFLISKLNEPFHLRSTAEGPGDDAGSGPSPVVSGFNFQYI